MLGACSEQRAESALVLCVYGPQPGKNCRICLRYAPAGPAVARRRLPVHPGALPPIPPAGPPAPAIRSQPAMFDAHFPDLTMLAPTSRRPHRDDHPGDPDPGRRHAHHLDLEPPRPCRRSRAHAVGELRGARDRRSEDGLRRGATPPHLRSARQADEPRPAPPAQHDVVLPRRSPPSSRRALSSGSWRS